MGILERWYKFLELGSLGGGGYSPLSCLQLMLKNDYCMSAVFLFKN